MMSGGGDGNPELLPCSESLPQLRAVVYRAVFNPRDFPSKRLWKLLSHKKRAAEGASLAEGSCEVPRGRSQGKLPGAVTLPGLWEGRRNFWDSVSVALILIFNSHPSCFPRVGACGWKPP